MGLFDKITGKTPPEDSQATQSSVWSGELSKAVADARSRGMGTKKRAKGDIGNDGEADSGRSVSKKDEESIRKMFAPEAWRAIVRTPFTFGQVATGRRCWELDKSQEDTLATTTSATAEHFLTTDPKWVALSLCMFNWAVILTEKVALNARERAKEDTLKPQPKVQPIELVKP